MTTISWTLSFSLLQKSNQVVFVSFDGSLHLGVDHVEDGLDEVVLVAVQHIRQVTSHLQKLFVDGLMGTRNKRKDDIRRNGKTFNGCMIQMKR